MRKKWQYRGKTGPIDAETPSEMSPLQQLALQDRFDNVAPEENDPVNDDIAEFEASRRPFAPEEAGWARASNAQQPLRQMEPQLPRPLQPTVKSQKQRLEIGQQMVPVDDYKDNHYDNHDNDHDTTNDKDVPDQTEYQKYLARVKDGKGSNCPLWNNDPWQAERQQLMETVVQLQQQVSDLTAANIKAAKYKSTADNIQTPMVKSIAIPIFPIQQDYDVLDFNNVMSAKGMDRIIITTINNGVTKRSKRSPNTDSSSECGDINNNTPYLNNVGIGSGNRGNGGGNDDLGDGSNGSGEGSMGRGYGYGTKRMEFTLVKSSNIAINTFSGSNLSTQPYLLFHKAIKRLIYNQGDDGELFLDILIQVEKYGAQQFGNAQLAELTRQCPKAGEFNRARMFVSLNYTSGNAKAMVEYGIENGFDAWRRLYHHYLPLAEDLQQILIQELY